MGAAPRQSLRWPAGLVSGVGKNVLVSFAWTGEWCSTRPKRREDLLRTGYREQQPAGVHAQAFFGGEVTGATLGRVREQHRGGHADVEALDEASHRHAHPRVHRAFELLADASVLVAEHHRNPWHL